MRKLRKNDRVMVIAGRDKGAVGTVNRVAPDGRLYVSGVNLVKRHVRANPNAGKPGGIIEAEAPMQASNLAIYNEAEGRRDKVGFAIREDGRRVRIYKSTGVEIED